MRRRRVLKKALALVAVVAIFSTGWVGAASNTYYAQTGLDGVIRCATAEQSLWVTGSATVNASATTRTSKFLYCSSAETYPASYMYVRLIMKQGGTVLIDRYTYNGSGGSAATDGTFFEAPPGTYTLQTKHSAAVNFANRIYPSSGFWTTSVTVV